MMAPEAPSRPTVTESETTPAMAERVPGHLARRFYQIHLAVMQEALAVEDLTANHYGVLVDLARTPGITQRVLAAQRSLDPVSTGQLIDELEQRGLVRRRADPADRRAHNLELTRAGKKLRERAGPIALRTQEKMLRVLSNSELATLRSLLARVIEANSSYDRPGAGRRRRVKAVQSKAAAGVPTP